MRNSIRKQSKGPHFPTEDMNQGNEKETLYWCSIYAPVISMYWNTGIKHTDLDIKTIGREQTALGLLHPGRGGKGSDGVEAVIKNKEVNLIKLDKFETSEIHHLLNKGYALTVGMGVNKAFVKDAVDGEINDFKDYYKYKGSDLKHFTTIIRYNGDDLIIDSYAYNNRDKEWVYKIDLKEFLEDLAYNTLYCIYN